MMAVAPRQGRRHPARKTWPLVLGEPRSNHDFSSRVLCLVGTEICDLLEHEQAFVGVCACGGAASKIDARERAGASRPGLASASARLAMRPAPGCSPGLLYKPAPLSAASLSHSDDELCPQTDTMGGKIDAYLDCGEA